MTDERTFELGTGFTLKVYREAELEEGFDASDAPGVTIAVHVKSCDDDDGEFFLSRIGFLEEENVGALISALTEMLEQSRAAAKERGHYDYLAAVEQEGKDESGWPPSWSDDDLSENDGEPATILPFVEPDKPTPSDR
jgi:hypothetical protein